MTITDFYFSIKDDFPGYTQFKDVYKYQQSRYDYANTIFIAFDNGLKF